MGMNFSAVTLSAAAALTPGGEPVTNHEIAAAALNPAARVAALQDGTIPTAPPLEHPLESGGEAPQTQDPQKQGTPTAGTPPPDAKVTPELNLEQKHAYSVALHQLSTLNTEVYTRIIAGQPVEQVMRDARAKLELSMEKNEISLASLERALRDPEGFAASQNQARDRIDKKNDDGFNVRENAYRERDIHNRFKKEAEASRLVLLDELREALQIRKDEAGILHNAMKPPYLTDNTLRGALTVTPMSRVVAGLSPEEKQTLTILRSPNDPNSALKPEEVRVLTDREKADHFDTVRPVEGKDPRPALKANRDEVLAKLTEAQRSELLEIERKAQEVAKQEVVMGVRGIPSGIEYHVAVDRSNSARGPWQAMENYTDRGMKMVYEGSIHTRDAAKACLKPREITSVISALEALNSSRKAE